MESSMHRAVYSILALSLLALGACAMSGSKPAESSAPSVAARAELRDAGGASKGTAIVTQMSGGIRLVIDASGLPAGAHGFHIHSIGKCDAPDFATAGPHWNPTGKAHGRDAPGGMHMGDLPNLIVGTDGSGRLEATISGATIDGSATPLLDTDGAAIVIHAGADDYRTDPSGNSGARVACGLFTAG
jgi:Cu-Zn family superoxide dismutase